MLPVPEPLVRIGWGAQSYFTRHWETVAAGLWWLLERYPEFKDCLRGLARIRGQVVFAHAAFGHRREAARWAGGALRRHAAERPPASMAACSADVFADASAVMGKTEAKSRRVRVMGSPSGGEVLDGARIRTAVALMDRLQAKPRNIRALPRRTGSGPPRLPWRRSRVPFSPWESPPACCHRHGWRQCCTVSVAASDRPRALRARLINSADRFSFI